MSKLMKIIITVAIVAIIVAVGGYFLINATKEEKNAVNNEQTKNNEAAEFTDEDLQIGGLSLHMSSTKMTEKLGDNYTLNEEPSLNENGMYESQIVYNDTGLIVVLEQEQIDSESKIKAIKMENNKTKAMRNIKILSTKQDILNAFKSENILEDKTENRIENIYVGFKGTNPHGGDGVIKFELMNERVSEISLLYGE